MGGWSGAELHGHSVLANDWSPSHWGARRPLCHTMILSSMCGRLAVLFYHHKIDYIIITMCNLHNTYTVSLGTSSVMASDTSGRPAEQSVMFETIVSELSQLPQVLGLQVPMMGFYHDQCWLIVEMIPENSAPHRICHPIDQVHISDATYGFEYAVEVLPLNFPLDVAVYQQEVRDVETGLRCLREELATLPPTSLPPDTWAHKLIDSRDYDTVPDNERFANRETQGE